MFVHLLVSTRFCAAFRVGSIWCVCVDYRWSIYPEDTHDAAHKAKVSHKDNVATHAMSESVHSNRSKLVTCQRSFVSSPENEVRSMSGRLHFLFCLVLFGYVSVFLVDVSLSVA